MNKQPTIWVDGDACPRITKEILFRAAIRTGVRLVLIANRAINVPRVKHIEMLQVAQGFDVADNEIVKRLNPGDMVVTADIPLASEVIDCGAHALNPRGERYSSDSIRAKLNIRDFLDTMRTSGVQTGGPPAMTKGERKKFADELDRYIAKIVLEEPS